MREEEGPGEKTRGVRYVQQKKFPKIEEEKYKTERETSRSESNQRRLMRQRFHLECDDPNEK
jgi:hypothetical protein